MDDQTKVVQRNGAPQPSSQPLARDVGEFAYDVLTLAELQVQLFVTDLQECRQRAFIPSLSLICGAALGLACFPVALAALAFWLIDVYDTSYATGFLLATIVGATLSAALCVIGQFQVRKCLAALRRSQEELVRNLRWIRKVLERNRTTRHDRTNSFWRL